LWEVQKYKNDVVIFNEVKPFEATQSISTITKTTNPQIQRISQEIKVYTEEELLKVCDDETRDLYKDLKNQILSLSNDIEIRPTKKYVAFRRKQQFVGFMFLKEKLKVYLSADSSQLQDPFNKVRDVTNTGHYSSGNSEIIVSNPSDIPIALSLIKQVYEKS